MKEPLEVSEQKTRLEEIKSSYKHWEKKGASGVDCSDIGTDCHGDGECGGDGE